ncbi:LacI family transcriptional regulator [Sutcliffiella horikoshii]|uniref:LacI family transcriptional regulator n=1 Tax=Sutcliffiella horikoshii TaxID=79883 RepID=A0ABM6KNR6_9BACI|nr:LacI family DNA-binding transcriptional regulator [Sutcliffiella horikoshii]ART78182.1 LacI family transcriptional regulator [Sutcliffiella horikoshii]
MQRSTVTIREVAKEAGLSVATISRYLNKSGYIGKKTEVKIKSVMEQLDYRPNEIARGLAKKKTNTIALIIPDITNPFFPELVVSIEKVAKSKGYNLILVNTEQDDLQENSFWQNFKNRYVDGVILASYQFNKGTLTELEAMNIPYVKIDRAADDKKNNSIGVNNYKGARLATGHLLDINCQNVAHIAGPQTFLPAIERTKGFVDTLIESPAYNKGPIVLEGDFTLESGMHLTKQLLNNNPDIDGIFLANDLMALGCLKQLKQMKKEVPEDIAIIGFDGITLTKMVEPEITTIQQPIYQIGVKATNTLISLIDNVEDETAELKLDVELVVRGTTKR